jgi:hypothetical protein
MEAYEDGKRFMRQLLLHRYKTLLEKLGQTYSLSEIQMRALEEKILNIHWIDSVL